MNIRQIKKLCLLPLLTFYIVACAPEERLQPPLPQTPNDPSTKPITEVEKNKIISIYFSLKYTHKLTSLIGENFLEPLFINPSVKDDTINFIKENCRIQSHPSPKLIQRVLYNKSFLITNPISGPKNCPLKFTQTINPTTNNFKHRVIHTVPMQVNLKITHPNSLPKTLLNEINFSGRATKITIFTTHNSGNSSINERVYGLIYDSNFTEVAVDYKSNIRYWWAFGETTALQATLYWDLKLNQKTYTIKEFYSLSSDGQLEHSLYLNNEQISKPDEFKTTSNYKNKLTHKNIRGPLAPYIYVLT